MKYVFGPVPSRRLGRSLGIDPTPPATMDFAYRVGPYDRPPAGKSCNWNCVYCQLGRTRGFTRSRSSFTPPAAVLAELSEALSARSSSAIDWITFVGSGEPTLNRDLGLLIRGVKSMTDIPVAVITNGSFLSFPGVRAELSAADAVMPSLDAGSSALFKRINRPPSEFGFERHLHGLVDFRAEYPGRLWLEVMLIDGINDDEASLWDIAAAVSRVEPDEVHIVLPTRPPAEAWVRPSGDEGIGRAETILGRVARVLLPDERRGGFGSDSAKDPRETAAEILTRHPMSVEELRASLARWGAADPEGVIQSLIDSGKAVAVERGGKQFLRGG